MSGALASRDAIQTAFLAGVWHMATDATLCGAGYQPVNNPAALIQLC